MLSQFVFILKIKIKVAFTLLFLMRFLFSLSYSRTPVLSFYRCAAPAKLPT